MKPPFLFAANDQIRFAAQMGATDCTDMHGLIACGNICWPLNHTNKKTYSGIQPYLCIFRAFSCDLVATLQFAAGK